MTGDFELLGLGEQGGWLGMGEQAKAVSIHVINHRGYTRLATWAEEDSPNQNPADLSTAQGSELDPS